MQATAEYFDQRYLGKVREIRSTTEPKVVVCVLVPNPVGEPKLYGRAVRMTGNARRDGDRIEQLRRAAARLLP